MLLLKVFSQSLGLVFVFTTIYKQQSSSYTPQGFIDIEGFDEVIKEGDWRNIIKHESALNSFTKAKGGKVSYNGKVVQSSLKTYLSSAVRQVEWQWDYYQKNRSIKKESHSFFITVMCIYH